MEGKHGRMKHKGLYILPMAVIAAGMTLLAGCSAEEAEAGSIPVVAGSDTPITFGASVNKSVTRAGETGNIDYSILAREDYGFGVFAYGADGGNWDNRQVTYDGGENDPVNDPVKDLDDVHMHTGNWSYGEEIMWKNQIISFLAYAPYVSYEQIAKAKADAAAANEDKDENPTGIIGVNESGLDGTYIQYAIATDPTESVDLLWGVREDANRNGDKRVPWLNTAVSDADEDDVLNVTGGKGVTFSFHHALAAIGFHVQVMIDQTNNTDDYEDESNIDGILSPNGNYKVTVKGITLSGKFYPQANLYLNNTESGVPLWKEYETMEEKVLRVGRENINSAFQHPSDKDITTAEMAKSIVTNSDIKGISQDAEQLVIAKHEKTNAEQCFFVIPNKKDDETNDYTLTFDWCVSYLGPNGRNQTQYIAEDHTNKLTIKDWKFRPGCKYYLNLVIGLKSVRLRVTATDWEDNPIYIEEIIEHGTSANESLAKKLR